MKPPQFRQGAPVVLMADDDWESMGKLFDLLYEFDVVCLRTWPQLMRAVARFEPDFVLLADSFRHRRTTARQMVEELFRKRGIQVIVLSNFVTPKSAASWKEWGASDCLLHPTKPHERALTLRRRLMGIDEAEDVRLRKAP